MDRRSLQHLLAAAALAVLAGCSSSSDDPAPADPVVTPPPPPPVNAPQSAAPGATSVTDIGEVFAKEADGFTLYTFENDRYDSDGDG